jgi:hypothetical protein
MEGEWFMQKFIFLLLAILTTFCIMLIGVAIGEGSGLGILLSIIGVCVFIGIGFKLKRSLSSEKE